MFRKPSPITEMLIREMQEVKHIIREVQEKMAYVDIDEVLEKHNKDKHTS